MTFCRYINNVDDRSYRDIRLKTAAGADDTGTRADNPDRTMLGATQLTWDSPLKWTQTLVLNPFQQVFLS